MTFYCEKEYLYTSPELICINIKARVIYPNSVVSILFGMYIITLPAHKGLYLYVMSFWVAGIDEFHFMWRGVRKKCGGDKVEQYTHNSNYADTQNKMYIYIINSYNLSI